MYTYIYIYRCTSYRTNKQHIYIYHIKLDYPPEKKKTISTVLVKIEGPVTGIPSIIIYLLLKGVNKPHQPTNQWESKKNNVCPMNSCRRFKSFRSRNSVNLQNGILTAVPA